VAAQQLGKYELRRPIGEGASATVHLAWDPFRRQEVAIKRLRTEVLNHPVHGRLNRQLLRNEASLAGRLVHPHIVQVHDAVIGDDEAYLVMDYIAGGTLAELARPGALPALERLLEIVFKCSRALDFAFHQGVTHRDIKPANILLADAGGSDIRLSDFGAALRSASDTTQIVGIGSPAYMSPQQVREMPVDHRSDIYSLGVVMFQLLTGRLPFEADNQYSLLYRIANETPPLPSELRRGIPPALDRIVRRATEKTLERRYQSWAEFSHDLALAFRNRSIELDRSAIPDTQRFQSLRAMPFFREFADAELWEVIGLAHWERVGPGTVVMKEGEPGEHFSLLVEGEARVRKRGKLLNFLSPGECFGEVALFSAGGAVRSASVETTTDSTIASIDRHALERGSETCRMQFYKALLGVLATRLSMASAQIANF